MREKVIMIPYVKHLMDIGVNIEIRCNATLFEIENLVAKAKLLGIDYCAFRGCDRLNKCLSAICLESELTTTYEINTETSEFLGCIVKEGNKQYTLYTTCVGVYGNNVDGKVVSVTGIGDNYKIRACAEYSFFGLKDGTSCEYDYYRTNDAVLIDGSMKLDRRIDITQLSLGKNVNIRSIVENNMYVESVRYSTEHDLGMQTTMFKGCSNLKKVTISSYDRLTTRLFRDCNKLKVVRINSFQSFNILGIYELSRLEYVVIKKRSLKHIPSWLSYRLLRFDGNDREYDKYSDDVVYLPNV